MVYSTYIKSKNTSYSTTNMVSLADHIGWRYDKLVYHFSRLGKFVYIDDDILIIRSEGLDKGRQGDKLANRGVGGKFIKR